MGRPRKVMDISTGKIGKKNMENRKEQEKKLKLDRDQLKAPSWLDVVASEEFERVVSEAESIDLLDNLDLGILAIYCNSYSNYVEISLKIRDTGYTEDRETKYDTYKVLNPLLNAQDKYVKQIMQCSGKLGLATTDRLKLIVPTKEEESINKYVKYLG